MSQNEGISLVTQGRIVWTIGKTLFEGKVKTNMQTKQVILDQKTGQPVVEYGFGLAIPKMDPRTNQFTEQYVAIYQALHGQAMSLYPSGHLPKDFAIKYKDGDTDIDDKGVPYSQREGYANHIVVACTTRIPLKFFRFEGGNNIMVNDGIKCGDYVNVQLTIKAHPAVGQAKAGLYVNPFAVQLIQSGQEIINTPSADTIFGNALPAYAGQVVAPTAPQMPAMMPQQAPMQPQQPMVPQAPAMPQQPVAAPQPHYGVLPNAVNPAMAPQAPAMPQQPQAPMAPQAPMMPQQPVAAPQMPHNPMMPPGYQG